MSKQNGIMNILPDKIGFISTDGLVQMGTGLAYALSGALLTATATPFVITAGGIAAVYGTCRTTMGLNKVFRDALQAIEEDGVVSKDRVDKARNAKPEELAKLASEFTGQLVTAMWNSGKKQLVRGVSDYAKGFSAGWSAPTVSTNNKVVVDIVDSPLVQLTQNSVKHMENGIEKMHSAAVALVERQEKQTKLMMDMMQAAVGKVREGTTRSDIEKAMGVPVSNKKLRHQPRRSTSFQEKHADAKRSRKGLSLI